MLHALIAICLLVVAQVNLLLHPAPVEPANQQMAQPSMAKRSSVVSPVAVAPNEALSLPDELPATSASHSPPEIADTIAAEPLSAFDLIREGNRYLSRRSQGKVVQVISGKTSDGLIPTDWRVVYYDPEATFKAVEIRFSANEVIRVFEPGRFLELFSARARKPMAANLLKIDSDAALEIALRETGLTDQTASKVEFKLETARDGLPVWKIGCWGRTANRETHLGEIIVSAYDGRVVKNRVRSLPQLQANACSEILLQNRF